MPGTPWLYLIDTSPRTDYLLSLLATILTGGVTAWVGLEGGSGWAVGALLGLTLVLILATAYAQSLWRKEQAKIESSRLRAVEIRAYR